MKTLGPCCFVAVRDQSGRVSSIEVSKPDALEIVGVLPHCSKIVPASVEDADKLVAWLSEWRTSQMGLKGGAR